MSNPSQRQAQIPRKRMSNDDMFGASSDKTARETEREHERESRRGYERGGSSKDTRKETERARAKAASSLHPITRTPKHFLTSASSSLRAQSANEKLFNSLGLTASTDSIRTKARTFPREGWNILHRFPIHSDDRVNVRHSYVGVESRSEQFLKVLA